MFFMGQEMTPEQSKQLKVGTRVCFNGDPADSGKVTSIEAKYVTIKWRDGHRSLTGHNEMKRVELVEPPKVKGEASGELRGEGSFGRLVGPRLMTKAGLL